MLALVLILSATSILNAQPCTPGADDQNQYGTNNVWRGYVYQGMSFNTYKGYVTEGTVASPAFDRNFGGDQVNYATNGCNVYTDTFSVRYRLTKTFANGNYDFTVGGDDGYRLSIDGGATWVINQWGDHSYQTTTTTVALNGTYNLVLEYYERFGGNRVSFAVVTGCTGDGDPAIYGTGDTWRGYLYQGMNFNSYRGYITRGALSGVFDENFGTANGTFATSNCSINTELFSARFRLRKTFAAGTYIITVGGDDGYRLSLNGGTTWHINHWVDQSYNVTTLTIYLNGTYDMVLEFYENGGDNRVSFNVSTSILPVTLKSWSAILQAPGKAKLSWVADGAADFDHFIVQRSVNGTDWNNLQNIANKNNNTKTSYSYDYTDMSVPEGNVFYRLVMVDRDGTLRNSGIQTVSNKTGNGFKVFPTLVENKQVVIRADKAITSGNIDIVNMNGQLLQSEKWKPGALSQQINLNNSIPSGTYIVRVKDGNGYAETQKIIVR